MIKPLKNKQLKVGETNLNYIMLGKGNPILLLHGWPTSSYLWRKMMIPLSKKHQVIALDLPGFGSSDRDPNASYSFNFHLKIIDGFLDALGVNQLSLVVHDLGGPLGLFWAIRNMERVQKLVFLNTLVYPEFSFAVKVFGLMTMVPGVRSWLSGPSGIAWVMRLGVQKKGVITKSVLKNYQQPFEEKTARKALLKTVQRLSPKVFSEIAQKLGDFKGPVLLLYGENDRILPDIKDTMIRIKGDLPQAELYSIPDCGHFLQEDKPLEVTAYLVEFFDK